MQVEFVGAAQTVTGSKHVVRTLHATILLDCGLFQGRRRESVEKNRSLGLDPDTIDAVVLSHAHIDHSGALPCLVKRGFEGTIYATPATRDLALVMLRDAARIQASDARTIARAIARGDSDMEPVEPLYDEADVVETLARMVGLPYHRKQIIAPGVTLSFLDAGHVLGSAITVLDVEEDGTTKRLVFTGDLGRRHIPILRDPEVPEGTTTLITESTYGDRNHAPIEEMHDKLAAILAKAHARGGKVVIPSFALERAQEVIYALNGLARVGRMPPMPVYVDSPLTVKITDVFRMHPECFDAEARAWLEREENPFEFDALKYVSDVSDSKAIDADSGSAVVISASGMCEAGRVLHHLKATIEDEKNFVVIVGYQAPHTLGRRIVEKRQRVKIYGVERDLRAEVAVLDGFSAHAGQDDLVSFVTAAREHGPVDDVVLVHGDPPAQRALAERLRERGFDDVHVPAPGAVLTL
ncbi:MAG: MBL fold metallo-hydrolase [Polyangiaceae bacterium]